MAYGQIIGSLAFVLALARAVAPVGASWAYAAAGGYESLLKPLTVIVLAAAATMILARRDENRPESLRGA